MVGKYKNFLCIFVDETNGKECSCYITAERICGIITRHSPFTNNKTINKGEGYYEHNQSKWNTKFYGN